MEETAPRVLKDVKLIEISLDLEPNAFGGTLEVVTPKTQESDE